MGLDGQRGTLGAGERYDTMLSSCRRFGLLPLAPPAPARACSTPIWTPAQEVLHQDSCRRRVVFASDDRSRESTIRSVIAAPSLAVVVANKGADMN